MALQFDQGPSDRLAAHAAVMARRFEILGVIADVETWAADGDPPLVVRVDCGAPFRCPEGWRRIDVDLGDLGDHYASEFVAARFERFERELIRS